MDPANLFASVVFLTGLSSISPVAILPGHDGGTDHVGGTLLALRPRGILFTKG
jgi:hypothetical protein